MADFQEVVKTIFSGLTNQLQKLNDLEDELKGFEDSYSKDYKIINDRVDDINVQIDRTIKDAISKIEIPTQLSENEIIEIVKAQIKEPDLSQLKKELQVFIKDNIKEPINGKDGVDGVDGKDATDNQVEKIVSSWIDKNKSELIGDRGERGEKGERGLPGVGQNGSDGVGIKDITSDRNDLVITLTDNTEKRIKLPQPQIQGGGGTSLINATSTQIVKVNKDTNLGASSQTVLVDATDGNINIKLPNPSNCFFGRSYIIGLTRTDLTTNLVTILPFKDETILHEASQDLFPKEVINLITDGTNWYYFS